MTTAPLNPEYRFYEADRLIQEGKVVEAAAMLQEIVADEPEFGRAYNHLGYIYETRFRDNAKAESYYLLGLQHAPDYPALYLNYAILLSSQQRWAELEPFLLRALDCPGINAPKILHEQGMMLEVQGKYQAALTTYQLAIQQSFSEKDIELFKRSVERVEGKSQFFKEREGDGFVEHLDPADETRGLN